MGLSKDNPIFHTYKNIICEIGYEYVQHIFEFKSQKYTS